MLFCFGLFALLLYNTVVANAECSYTYVNDSRPIEAEAAEFHRRGYRCCVFLIQAPNQYRVTLNFTNIFGFHDPPASHQDSSAPHRGHLTHSLSPHPSSTSSNPPTPQNSGPQYGVGGEGGPLTSSSSPDPSSSSSSSSSSFSSSSQTPDEPPTGGKTGGLRDGPVHTFPEQGPGVRGEGGSVSLAATVGPQDGDAGAAAAAAGAGLAGQHSAPQRERNAEEGFPGRGKVDNVEGRREGRGRGREEDFERGLHAGGKRAGEGHAGSFPNSMEAWLSDVEGDFPEVQVREVLPGQEKVFAVISQSRNNHQSPQVMETRSQSVKVVYIWGPGHHSGFTLYFDFVRNATSLCDEAHGERQNCVKAPPSNPVELTKVVILVGCVAGGLVVVVAGGLFFHAKCRTNSSLLHHYPHSRHPHHHPQSQSSEVDRFLNFRFFKDTDRLNECIWFRQSIKSGNPYLA